MSKFLTILFCFYTLQVIADTSEPLTCEQIGSYNDFHHIHSCDESDIELKAHINADKIEDDKTDESIKKLEINQAIIKAQSDSLEQSMWSTLDMMSSIFYGVFGLGITAGGIFVWRENYALKLRFQSELQEVTTLKTEVETRLNDIIKLLDSSKQKYNEELSSSKTRFDVENMLNSSSLDIDFLYTKVRFLEQFPTTDNLILLMKIYKDVRLTEDFKEDIHNSISKIKIELEKNDKF